MDKNIFITAPDPTLKLTYADVWLPGLYSRRVMCFELPLSSSQERVVDVVHRGLKALVQGTPEIAATSVVIPDAAPPPTDKSMPWRALEASKGLELIVKDLSSSVPSYKKLEAAGFPLSAFRDDLLMPIAGPIMPEPQPEGKFQLSFIEGGVLLSVCLYHHLTDGNGMNSITRALGELCKLAAETPGDLPPKAMDTDRSKIDAINGTMTDLKHHPAYDMLENAWVPGAHHDEAPLEANGEEPPPPPEFRPHYYHLSHERAQALKDYGSRDTPVSTHDAISAAIWRNLIRSRVKTGELKDISQSSIFSIPHNARKYLGLDEDFVGNCTYFIQAEATISEIIDPDSLPILAARIRARLNAVDTEHVEGIFTVRRDHPFSLNWAAIVRANDPDIVGFTSFYHSGLMGTDWGAALGEIKHFTSTDIGAFGSSFQRAHFVGPKLPNGRGCDVHIGITKAEVEHYGAEPLWNRFFRLREVTAEVNGTK